MIAEAINELIALGRSEYRSPAVVEEGGIPFAIVPEGANLVSAEEYLPRPVRQRDKIDLADWQSFVDYYKRFQGPETLVVASLSSKTVTAIFDHGAKDSPGRGDHAATLRLEQTPEWAAWKKAASTTVGQTEFAEFLEDNAHTVIEPDSAKLIDVALNLQARSDVKFESRIDRFTGGSALTFIEDVQLQNKGQIKLPDKLHVSVAPYRFSKPIDLLVRLRIRIQDGKAKFALTLDRPWKAEDDAFMVVVGEVRAHVPEVLFAK